MKWRKVKKKFKKNKHEYLGWNMGASAQDGSVILGAISDVKIHPAGGKNINYEFFATPTQVKKSEPKEGPHYPNNGLYSNRGFNLTFDMKLDTPTNEVMKLLKG